MLLDVESVSWNDWWTYDGISGPAFWGLINPEWSLCNAGRKQSPVNIEPEKLLYDHTLEKITIGQDKVSFWVFHAVTKIFTPDIITGSWKSFEYWTWR